MLSNPFPNLPTSSYQRRDGKWFWLDNECKGADHVTFTPLNDVWAADCKGVFKQNTRLRAADPQSLQVLNLLYAKDDVQVYYIMGVAKDIVDVATFEVLDPGIYSICGGSERRLGFARDSENVYVHEFFSGKPKVLRGADRGTFVRLQYGYANDNKAVWFESERIKGCDPNSFQPINEIYSKDKNHVFYGEATLRGADPSAFHLIGEFTGTDGVNVWLQRDLIVGADAKTYRADRENPFAGRDAVRTYEHGKPV
jgi:hypothetical protein